MKNSLGKINYLANLLFCCLSSLAIAVSPPAVSSNKDTIKIGMSAALTGPVQELGLDMKQGIETYFEKINASGGINGKPLELIALDDQYDPALAAPNMRRLIDTDQVLAVIGNVGTPTAVVTLPITNEKKTLLFGAFTGADLLRKVPPDRYVINFRASYAEETAFMIKGLLSIGIKPDELAFFTQNDAYGDSGYKGAMTALKAAGYADPEALPHARYSRNTLNVEEGLGEILATNKIPKAIIMVGTYAPNAKFIKLAKKAFPDTLFLNVSFVGTQALVHELGSEGNQVIITQVVPFFDKDLPAIRDYQQDIKRYFPNAQPTLGSLEGYLAAKVFVLGLQQAANTNKLTREGIIDVFETMNNVDIGMGDKISFDKNHHQALHTVWLTQIKNGTIEATTWQTLSLKTEGNKLK